MQLLRIICMMQIVGDDAVSDRGIYLPPSVDALIYSEMCALCSLRPHCALYLLVKIVMKKIVQLNF